jgi:hypothetical protein
MNLGHENEFTFVSQPALSQSYMHNNKSGNNKLLDWITTESEYGSLGLSIVIVARRYVISKTKFN